MPPEELKLFFPPQYYNAIILSPKLLAQFNANHPHEINQNVNTLLHFTKKIRKDEQLFHLL